MCSNFKVKKSQTYYNLERRENSSATADGFLAHRLTFLLSFCNYKRRPASHSYKKTLSNPAATRRESPSYYNI